MINRTSRTTHPSNHLQKLHHMTHEILNSKTATTFFCNTMATGVPGDQFILFYICKMWNAQPHHK